MDQIVLLSHEADTPLDLPLPELRAANLRRIDHFPAFDRQPRQPVCDRVEESGLSGTRSAKTTPRLVSLKNE